MTDHARCIPVRRASRRRGCATSECKLPLTILITLFALAGCTRTAVVVEPPVEISNERLSVPHRGLIPVPIRMTMGEGAHFEVSDQTQIVVPPDHPDVERIGQFLADLIGNTRETMPDVVTSGAEGAGAHIYLMLNGGATTDDEGYALEVAAEGVRLTGRASAGLFYGVQTLRQLLPPYVEYGAALRYPLRIPAVHILDAPRYAWRGTMLDVARHFFPVEAVKRYIDLMALYKLNRLHLHLSDDQGWRIEIPGWPRLTQIGGSSQVGGKGSGFYSVAEYEEIVRYAAARFITIVPEIDMPGHTNSALASYSELNCEGGAPPLYTGTHVGFSYLCVEKEETYRFVEDVVREISARTPGVFFHVGGDEVDELTEEQYVRFMERAQEIVGRHGKTMVGWDEIAEVDLELNPGTLVQVWRPQTPGTAQWVREAVASGARLILSPADRIYLDMKYDSNTVLGLAWAGYNPVRDAYDWEPAEFIPGVGDDAIEGIEAPLWTETIDRIQDVEHMAFPRLAGVAEMAWSPRHLRDWDAFRVRLAAQEARWTALGVNFYRAPKVQWDLKE